MSNNNLQSAKKAKNDEFYTMYKDIDNELKHYVKHFRGKTIYCNCDNPEVSNFWKYFKNNFNEFGLRRLISTHYEADKPSYEEEMTGINETKIIPLKQNGDFRSPECLKLLDECDICITNPPFSLFREFLQTLIEHNKEFLIIGNKNALTYKEVFPLIRDNKLWLGYGFQNGNAYFRIPDDADVSQYASGVYNAATHCVKFRNCCWFTNIDYEERHEDLILYENYTSEKYPKYDNYDAINVDKVDKIPCDYYGTMGVPITFLDKYNPEQFEILELGNGRDNFTPNKDYINPKMIKNGKESNGNALNRVLAYKVNKIPSKGVYYTADNCDSYLFAPYARILIKRKENSDED